MMIYKGKRIINKITGQQLTFTTTPSESQGKVLEMEMVFTKQGPEPPLHYHPSQDETFAIHSGEVNIRLNGTSRIYRSGDVIRISRNTPHAMWNTSNTPARITWRIEPAMRTANFFEDVFELVNAKNTGNKGEPALIDKISLAYEYSHEIRLSKPSFAVIRFLYVLFFPIIRIRRN
jgi:quercetin dioxygenase-like cupin family protein